MKKLLIVIIILSGTYLFSENSLYENNDLQIMFSYPSKWEITLDSEKNIRIQPLRGGKFPMIGINVSEEPANIKSEDVRAFYKNENERIDVLYNNQFLKFHKEHAKLVWMNSGLALYYQFKFVDTEMKEHIGKQIICARGRSRYIILLIVTEKEFHKYDNVLNIVTESFIGYKYLPITSQGLKNYKDGIKHYFLGNYTDSKYLFDKVIYTDPDFSEGYFYKGLSVQASAGYGNIKESSVLFGKAVMKNSEHFPAMNQVALCWAISASPDSQEGVENMKKAFKVIDDAINVNSFCEETLLNKASLLINIGNNDLAMKFLNRVLELNPRNREAKGVKNKLIKKITGLK